MDLEKFNKLSTKDLLEEIAKTSNSYKVVNQKAKNDTTIKDLASQEKELKAKNLTDEDRAEIKKLKNELKEYKDKEKEGLEDISEDLKALRGGYRDEKNRLLESLSVLTSIWNQRK